MSNYEVKQKEVYSKAEAIQKRAEAEARPFSDEEKQEFDSCLKQIEELDGAIARQQQMFSVADKMKKSNGRISPVVDEKSLEPVHEDIERYSLMKAFNDILEFGQVKGLEAEASAEIRRKQGGSYSGQFTFPNDTRSKEQRYKDVEKYTDLTTSTGSGAVRTVVDYADFISLLRNKTLVVQLGAMMLTDLSGNFAIPRQSGPGTAVWSDGNSSTAITTSNQTIDQVALNQKTLGASTQYSRAFMKQASFDVENFVREDLARVLSIELDRAALNGSGSGSIPTGILQTSGTGSVTAAADSGNGGVLAWADITSFETQLGTANADFGALAYVTTPGLRGKLKATTKASNYPAYLWENNEVNGYPAYATNNMPSGLTTGSSNACHSMIFANWNDVVIGSWTNGTDVIVNPYSLDASGSGAVRITLLSDYNIALRHKGSFCICTDALLA